jgi:hypothetical protein
MKTRFTSLTCAILLCAWTSAFAADINVPGDQATIAAAVGVANPGDTIWVAAGTYAGATVNKAGLTINGPNYEINPNTGVRVAEAQLTSALAVQADGVTIQGFLWDGVSGISTNANATNFTLARNIIRNTTSTGLSFTPFSNTVITENLVENVIGVNNSGMNINANSDATDGIKITYNVIRNTNYAGLQFSRGKNWFIAGNTISNTPRQGINCGSGVYVGDTWILGNTINNASFNNEENRGGIRLYAISWSKAPADGHCWIMYNTVISSSNGIRVRACEDTSSPDSCQLDPTRFTIQYNNFLDNERFGFSHPGGTPAYPLPAGDIDLSDNYFADNTNGEAEGPTENPGGFLAQPQPLDSDGDGLPDWEEIYVYNTDPANPDSDGDGVDDGIEVALETDPNDNGDTPDPGDVPSKTADTDGDGFADAYEVSVGSDPNNAASRPTLADVNGNGAVDNVDAVIVYNISLGNLAIQNFEFTRMDVNLDGVVNNQDAVIIFNYFLGNIPMLPVYP